MTSSKSSIIQWNICGIRNKKKELLHLANSHEASIIALQETLQQTKYLYKIPGYTVIGKDGTYNRRNHGGVALYIHQDVPHSPIPLTTSIQAVAAVVHLKTKVTICNIYNSRSHQLSVNDLNNLYNQLPQPCIILGDFNAYHLLWGCQRTDDRGRMVETFVGNTDLVVLNNGAPTHPNPLVDTAIDLTLCSASISQDFEWDTEPSVLDSDHFPIIISTQLHHPIPSPIRLMNRADWDMYRVSEAWNDLPEHITSSQEILDDLYVRINLACDEAIPTTIPSKFYPKPFWSPDLTRSRNLRETLYKRYRRCPSLQNQIRWKRARATHKNNVRLHKEKEWRDFTSNLNDEMPITEICNKVKKLKGLPPRSIRILSDVERPGITYSTPEQISEVLGQNFAAVSSDSNYSTQFLRHKTQSEQNLPDFGTSNSPYNQPFTIIELERALGKTGDSAPGEDGVHYRMLKNMPQHAREHLVKIYNHFFLNSFFPERWRKAITVPLPKPKKNPNCPTSYRPIALTSCLCKLMERLVNERFREFLAMHKIIHPSQSGGQKARSTTDHLVRLEDEIKTAFASNQHFISIFFDLERAYDMAWRGGILLDLYQIGLRGCLPKYIEEFLKVRKFQVRVGNVLSNEYHQQNGIPQGAVLSVLLFALRINNIVKVLPVTDGFMHSLFVDDLQIGYRHSNITVIKNVLQSALGKLSSWTSTNGFKFSSLKTKIVHFTKSNSLVQSPALRIGNEPLSYSPSAKFLGVEFDSKLTFRPHLAKLKVECQKLLGIMKMVAALDFGATQEFLMKVYRIYLRTKLDYGSIIYSSACQGELKKLDVVNNEALRIATGAFKSSPIDSLYVLADEMKPKERREYLSMRYFLKIKASLHNPANQCITNRNITFFRNTRQSPLIIRCLDIQSKYNLPSFLVKPDFSYQLHNCTTPKYALSNPSLNLEIAEHKKEMTPPDIYKQIFLLVKNMKYSSFSHVYTDGSKSSDGVGAAAISARPPCTATLPKEATIFSAEAHALQMAVDSIDRITSIPNPLSRKYVIFTDSMSVIQSLQNLTDHPVILYLAFKLDRLKRRSVEVEICWVPSHVDIRGNDRADAKAKEVSKRRPELIPIYYKDYYPVIRAKFYNSRNNQWRNMSNPPKLRHIKPDLSPWPSPSLRRREQVVLNRIRIGHTNMTHNYLMDTIQPRIPPICPYCNNSTLTIAHIFTQCPSLETQRRHHFRPLTIWNLETMLGIHADPNKILSFLRENQIVALV